MSIAVGLDCGGSTTRLLASRDGAVIFEAQSGPANWASTPRSLIQEHLRMVFARCPSPDVVVACFAGLLTSDDQRQARTLVSTLCPKAKCEAYPDGYAALRACDDPQAVVVISGTGALVFSKVDDKLRKTGGGGPMIDDCGSGAAVGRSIIRHWLRREPGHEILQPIIAESLSLTSTDDMPNEVIGRIYRAESPAMQLATIGSFAARTGNEFVQELVQKEMQELALLCQRHIREIGPDPAKVYRTGGFWNASPFVLEQFELALGQPTFEPKAPPLTGALWLAEDSLL